MGATDRLERQLSEPERVDLVATDTRNDGKPDIWVADTTGDGLSELIMELSGVSPGVSR